MVKDIFDGIGHRSGKGTCGLEKAGPSKRQVKLSILASFREVRVAPSQYHNLEKKTSRSAKASFPGGFWLELLHRWQRLGGRGGRGPRALVVICLFCAILNFEVSRALRFFAEDNPRLDRMAEPGEKWSFWRHKVATSSD